mgnify:CR=1 FL=1
MAITLKIVDGDIVISPATGFAQTISGNDLVKQHVAENMMLDRQNSGLGAGIRQLVGNIIDDAVSMSILLRDRISSSFVAMRNAQNQAPRGTYNSTELVNSTKSLVVQRAKNDPRSWQYKITVVTESGAAIGVTDIVKR